MHKTDYLGIHERAYKRIIAEGRPGWSDQISVNQSVEIICKGMGNLDIQSGDILELGCGDGSISLELQSNGYRVFGIDIVPLAIDWARRKTKDRESDAVFLLGGVTSLPYRAKSFDVVIDASCSHCIIGEDRADFFSEAYRVLKKNGLFILNALCGDPQEDLMPYFDPPSRCLMRNGVSGRFYGKPLSIKQEAESAGFRILDWETEKNEYEDEEIVLYCSK